LFLGGFRPLHEEWSNRDEIVAEDIRTDPGKAALRHIGVGRRCGRLEDGNELAGLRHAHPHFITGALIIIVSDVFTWAGIWTPFIAAIIGMLGFIGGILRRFRSNPSTIFLGASAVSLTLISELLQNLWFAWYMQAFYMPETPFIIVLGMTFVGGIKSAIVALINNIVLFITIVPRIVEVLRNVVTLDDASKEADLP
jgi:hypothetical protein